MMRIVLIGMLVVSSCGCGAMKTNTGEGPQETGMAPAVPPAASSDGGPPAIDGGDIDVAVQEPTAEHPVSLGIAIRPSQAKPGDTVALVVRAKMFEPWHIYAAEGPTGVGIPTQLQLDAPEWISASAWGLPGSRVEESPLGPMALYEGDVRFVAELTVSEDAPAGRHPLEVKVTYQSCNETQCLPPTTEALQVALEIVAPQ